MFETVADLIDALQKLPPGMPVRMMRGGGLEGIQRIETVAGRATLLPVPVKTAIRETWKENRHGR